MLVCLFKLLQKYAIAFVSLCAHALSGKDHVERIIEVAFTEFDISMAALMKI